MKYEFNELFPRAKEIELLCRAAFRDAGFKTRKGPEYVDGYHPVDFYVTIDDKEYGVEVKEDIYSVKSGNLFFETKALQDVHLTHGNDDIIIIYFVTSTRAVYIFKDIVTLKQDINNCIKYSTKGCREISHAGNYTKGGCKNPGIVIPIPIVSTWRFRKNSLCNEPKLLMQEYYFEFLKNV